MRGNSIYMGFFATILLIVTIISSFHPLQDRPRDEILIPAGTSQLETTLHYGIKPLSEFKNANVVKQKFDFSCGSAALATIMNFYLGEALTESQVIQGLLEYGNKGKIKKRRAFSLLDMKRFVTTLGYNVAGYTADTDDLRSLGIPCIIPIDVYGYKHFVVFRGVYRGHIFCADPYMGNISFSEDKFREIWYKNIVFIVTNSGNEIDTLCLKDEDLRIVDFDMTRRAVEEFKPPRSVILDQQRLNESSGKYFYINR